MLQACFIWRSSHPAIMAAAAACIRHGWHVDIICAEPCAVEGSTVHVLDDRQLRRHPPRGIEAAPIDAMRFALAASDLADTLHRERPFHEIHVASDEGPGWIVGESRRLTGAFAGASLIVHGTHPASVLRAHDRTCWHDLGDGLRDRIERLALARADLAVVATKAMADATGWDDRPIRLHRPCLTPLRVMRAGATGILSPGPIREHLRHDVVVRAFVAAFDAIGAASRHLAIEGPDTPTGPLGASCAARLSRHVPARCRDAVVIGVPAGDAIDAGTIVLAGSLAADHRIALEAFASGARVLCADTAEHRELAGAAEADVTWFAPGDIDALAALLAAPATTRAPSPPRGFIEWTPSPVHARPVTVVAAISPADVTVVIPHFNLGEHLPATLASVAAQTVRGCRTLIVDDGSTDESSIALIDSLERSGTPVLRTPNGGLGSARNAGLRAATTPWVLTLDADDLLAPEFLERTLAAAARRPGAAAVGTFMRCFTTDPSSPTGGWMPLGLDRDLLASANHACPASCLLRRDAALEAGGYDEHLVSFEDWDLWCTLAERGHEAVIVPEFLLFYRQRPDSMYHALAIRNEALLRAELLARHPRLCDDWSRAMRVEVAMRHHVEFGQGAAGKPLRYVLADRMNHALKRLGIHQTVKRLVTRDPRP
jgi:glycosyltransferase involved in cell wall biosynthesis